jgi:short-subunit dehydrogenase
VKFAFENGVAVVTGAGAGIGGALALGLAARGCHIAAADVDAERLATTAARARASGVKVSEHVFDVTEADAIRKLPEVVLAQHGRVTLLVNNAGVALGGRFEDIPAEQFAWLFEVNFWSVVHMMQAFLPALRKAERAQIVNISSLFGLVSPVGQSAYAATKFAVRAVSEALRHELEEESGPVRLSVVHPGGVRTNILENARRAGEATMTAEEAARHRARYEKLLRVSPEKAAAQILEGIARRKKRILVGSYARQGDLVQRFLPSHYWLVLRQRMKTK